MWVEKVVAVKYLIFSGNYCQISKGNEKFKWKCIDFLPKYVKTNETVEKKLWKSNNKKQDRINWHKFG